MEVVMFYAELGQKLAVAAGFVVAVWLAVAVLVAVPVGRLLARAAADYPCPCEDPALDEDGRLVCDACGEVLL